MKTMNRFTILIFAIAICGLANAMLSVSIYQALHREMDENFTSDAEMVDTWNEGSKFIARQIIVLQDNQADIAAHLGLIFTNGGVMPERFDLECMVVNDDMDPPLLKCDKTFGQGG